MKSWIHYSAAMLLTHREGVFVKAAPPPASVFVSVSEGVSSLRDVVSHSESGASQAVSSVVVCREVEGRERSREKKYPFSYGGHQLFLSAIIED